MPWPNSDPPRPQDHPCRHGRLLRVGRAARRSGAARASRSRSAAGIAEWSRRRATRRGKFGVRSAMPSVTAKRRCPELIFVKPRFDVYRAVSQQIRAIFADYTDLVEPLSLDEAYLDVTEDRLGLGSARGDRRGHPPPDPRGDRAHRLGRRQLLQVHRQARLRPPQARRPVRDHARARAGVRRLAAGRALPRRRAGHRAQDGAARHPHRRRPARLEPARARRRISAARPTGIGGSAAASTSARSSPTGRTSRSAPSAPSTRICAIPTASPPSSSGSPAMPGTGSSAPRSPAGP